MRTVQAAWSVLPLARRLAVLQTARHRMATVADAFAAAISPALTRNHADTLVAEVLPLLDACRFLERHATKVLATRYLGRSGRPLWLAGVRSEVQRVALGKVLVIAPSNYPLFIPGVQALQALAAGNAVVWKPGRGGKAVADLFVAQMNAAGLPSGLMRVTDDSVEAAKEEIYAGADKVFFTGSSETGRTLLRELAQTTTPSVMELSGCDAVIVLPSANLERAAKAVAFGLRFNGSATCMAPRRLIVLGATAGQRDRLIGILWNELAQVKGVLLPSAVRQNLLELLDGAVRDGAQLYGKLEAEQRPLLLTHVTPAMQIAKADLFVPLLLLMEAEEEGQMLVMLDKCPYALTVAVFGNEQEARRLAQKTTAGTVFVNDLIVPAADARVPFGGRRQSGFGVTRGGEGLLEMTAVKVISVRHGGVPHFEAATTDHKGLFAGLIAATHATGMRRRWHGLRRMMTAARRLKNK